MAAARVRKEEAEGRWDARVNVGYQRQDFGFDLRGLTESGATRPIHDVFHYFELNHIFDTSEIDIHIKFW